MGTNIHFDRNATTPLVPEAVVALIQLEEPINKHS